MENNNNSDDEKNPDHPFNLKITPEKPQPPSKRKIAAVTGASGFIGSYVCQELLERGYEVRACVRENIPHKTDHLWRMAKNKAGKLEICVADLSIKGAYDDIVGNNCEYVFHVAGNFGTDYELWKEQHNTFHNNDGDNTAATTTPKRRRGGRLPPKVVLQKRLQEECGPKEESDDQENIEYYSYDQAVYDSYVRGMEGLLESVHKHRSTIKTVVYTSSGAAGGTVVKNNNHNTEKRQDKRIRRFAYGAAKHDCEALLYDFCKSTNGDVVGVSVCPCIVLGPLLSTKLHDTVYQHRLSDMLRGRYLLEDQHWDIADVRNVAKAHVLLAEQATNSKNAESPSMRTIGNGSRVWIGTEPAWKVRDLLQWLIQQKQKDKKASIRLTALIRMLNKYENGSDSESNNSGNSNISNCSGSSCSGSSSGNDSGDGSSSASSSSSSYGISEWDTHKTTTWSNPNDFLEGYTAFDPQTTVLDTVSSILEGWNELGRDYTINEALDYYTVAEMDGCHQEMDWLERLIRAKTKRKLQQLQEHQN